jgi:hypothetical protein
MDEEALAAALAKLGMLAPQTRVEADYSQPYLIPEVEADVLKAMEAVKAGLKPEFKDELPEALQERNEFLAAQLRLLGV